MKRGHQADASRDDGPARSIRVIGLGNGLRRDDGAGRAVVRRLEADGSGAALAVTRGEPAELIDAWSGFDAVIVVDAVRSGARAGTVHRLDVSAGEIPPESAPTSSHGLGLAAAIGLARALGVLPARFVVYGIEGSDFGQGAGLSPEVEAAVEVAVSRVREELARWRDDDPPPSAGGRP